MSKVTGGCLCGQVRYESDADPQMIAICHCSHCQKVSGSAFSVNLAMPAESVRMTGDLTTYEDVGTSGKPVLRMFCDKCGSSIGSDVKAFPGLLFLKAGTLDDASWVQPGLEIWTDSAQSWVTPCEAAERVAGNPS